MARDITVTFDDGSTHVYRGAPDDATPEQVTQRATSEFGRAVVSLDGGRKADARPPLMRAMQDFAGGAVRGAGSIGATLLTPYDMLAGNTKSLGNPERRAAMDDALRTLGVDTESTAFGAGKLGTEIAGTMGAGGFLARGASMIPGVATKAAPVIDALSTAGMRAGSATGAPALAARAVGGAITGGASAGLVNPEDAKTGAMIGGGFPLAAKLAAAGGTAVGAGVRKMGGEVAPEVAALANRAKQLGIDIPADRLVSSKPLDAVASALNYVPFSGRAATEANMSTQLNQALSRTFGQNSSNVTQALRKADNVLGGQFDDFLRQNTVRVDQQFMADLAEASNQAARELGTDGASIIAKQVDDIIAKAATGEIDGQAAYNIKKALDRIGKRNSPEAWYALDLKKKLMEALNRSVGPDQAQGFAQLRQQYGNMLELEKLAKNGAEGEISVARLANLKNVNNSELQELADIAAQFVKPREGQHGAMQRAVVGLGTASTAGPIGLGIGAGVGRGTNMLLNSNAMRNTLLGTPSQGLGLLDNQLLYRPLPALAAPLIGDQ